MNFNTPALHITNEEMGHGLVRWESREGTRCQEEEGSSGLDSSSPSFSALPRKRCQAPVASSNAPSGKRVNPRASGFLVSHLLFLEKCCRRVSSGLLPEPLTKLCRCPLLFFSPLKPEGSCFFPGSRSQNLLLSSLWHKI